MQAQAAERIEQRNNDIRKHRSNLPWVILYSGLAASLVAVIHQFIGCAIGGRESCLSKSQGTSPGM